MIKFGIYWLMLMQLGSIHSSPMIVVQEEVEQMGEIIQAIDGCTLSYHNGYILMFKDQTAIVLNQAAKPKLIEDGENIVVFYTYQKKLMMQKYDQQGHLLQSKMVFDNPIDSDFTVYVDEKGYFIGGGIQEYINEDLIQKKKDKNLGGKDAVLIQLTKDGNIVEVHLYGGIYNEHITHLGRWGDQWLVVVRKFGLSGGDFGYAGNQKEVFVLALLQQDFSIRTFETFATMHTIHDLKIIGNQLFLLYERGLYVIDEFLHVQQHVQISQTTDFAMLSAEKEWVYINNEELTVYSIENLQTVFRMPFFREEESVFRNVGTKLYYKDEQISLYMDILDFRKTVIDRIYLPEQEDSMEIHSLFGPVRVKGIEVDRPMQPQIHGTYHYTVQLTSIGDIKHSFAYEKNVLMESNVQDGGIYPIGYALAFTGYAKLNNQSIVNNYKMMQAGKYQLELTSVGGESNILHFEVHSSQIDFQDKRSVDKSYYDKIVEKSEVYSIDLIMDQMYDVEVLWVTINDTKYTNHIVFQEEQFIRIFIQAPNQMGMTRYHVESITYLENDSVKTHNIHQYYNVFVVEAAPALSIENQGQTLSLKISCHDRSQTARFFEWAVESNHEYRIVRKPLYHQDFLIDQLSIGKEYSISFRLAYDRGIGIEYTKPFLVTTFIANQESVRLGAIEISKRQQSLENFEILFESNASSFTILEMKVGNTILYESMERSNQQGWIHLVIGGIVSASIIGGVRFFIKKKLMFKRNPPSL